MKNPQFPVARKNGLVVQEIPDEVLVYDLSSNKAHCLNQTAALVWKSCDGVNSVSEIAKLVGSQSGGSINDDFVWLAIDQLSENNLLEEEITSALNGQSRREVIKKIGLSTMIAIPVIASLVAPQSAMAANSCNCTSVGSTTQCAVGGVNGNCPARTCNANFFCI